MERTKLTTMMGRLAPKQNYQLLPVVAKLGEQRSHVGRLQAACRNLVRMACREASEAYECSLRKKSEGMGRKRGLGYGASCMKCALSYVRS